MVVIPTVTSTDDAAVEIRAFNRFYTKVIGVLGEGLLRTPYSLTEARIIFELAARGTSEVPDLRHMLDLDGGYLSRILARFEADGLVTRARSKTDRRRQVVALTPRGNDVFCMLDQRAADEAHTLVSAHTPEEQRRLLDAMRAIRDVLDPGSERWQSTPLVLRPPHPGEFGWVIQRHGELYAREFGWDQSFEVLVARVVADFAARYDSARERAWIADVNGTAGGCVFCVRKEDKVAQLRLLLVEPAARGSGVGSRLVDECLAFARAAGYEEIVLWTNDVLEGARRLYERAGFELRQEDPHHSFGHDLVGQIWGRPL
jgi:DNA-binding MarR family transcriptional regulator/GNAT superfamily N-acetyltransferase